MARSGRIVASKEHLFRAVKCLVRVVSSGRQAKNYHWAAMNRRHGRIDDPLETRPITRSGAIWDDVFLIMHSYPLHALDPGRKGHKELTSECKSQLLQVDSSGTCWVHISSLGTTSGRAWSGGRDLNSRSPGPKPNLMAYRT